MSVLTEESVFEIDVKASRRPEDRDVRSDADERYIDLVRSFPTLTNAPGVYSDFIDVDALDTWAASAAGSGARSAAAFVLNLWSGRGKKWRVGAFDVFLAMEVWDDHQLRAWQAWAAAPWMP